MSSLFLFQLEVVLLLGQSGSRQSVYVIRLKDDASVSTQQTRGHIFKLIWIIITRQAGRQWWACDPKKLTGLTISCHPQGSILKYDSVLK